jgi:hypothetical protein
LRRRYLSPSLVLRRELAQGRLIIRHPDSLHPLIVI